MVNRREFPNFEKSMQTKTLRRNIIYWVVTESFLEKWMHITCHLNLYLKSWSVLNDEEQYYFSV